MKPDFIGVLESRRPDQKFQGKEILRCLLFFAC